jgi:hypothetical protein
VVVGIAEHYRLTDYRTQSRTPAGIARARHAGCGGKAAKVELLTGVDGLSSRPVPRIVLRAG